MDRSVHEARWLLLPLFGISVSFLAISMLVA
jgi:hypothetical protein